MIYSMEKVLETIEGWMDKAINFHKQQACIITLKKEHGLPLSSFSSTSCFRDPNAMDVEAVHLKKLSPADQACCVRKGLCFRCCKKGCSVNECRSTQTQGGYKRNNHQVRNAETSSSTTSTPATIASITPINIYIQNLTTMGRTTKISSRP